MVGLARVGWDDQRIVACSLGQMASLNLGPPLHCMIIPAIELHPLESEFLIQYATDESAMNGTINCRNETHEIKNESL